MKSKRILKFYFGADGLEQVLDRIILRFAISPDCERGGEFYTERVLRLVNCKVELSKLWAYLDGVARGLTERDLSALSEYAFLRYGIRRLDDIKRRDIKRAVMKFTRRARGLGRFAEGLRLVNEYYCLF